MKFLGENALFIFTFIILETAILSNIAALPVVPDLILILTVYVSLTQGCTRGETNGFFSGLLLDFLSAAPLGLNAFIRTAIGFVAGLFSNAINIQGIVVPCVIGLVATLLKAFALGMTGFFFPGVYAYDLFSPLLWQECAVNLVCTPVVFSFFRRFDFFSPTLDVREVR